MKKALLDVFADLVFIMFVGVFCGVVLSPSVFIVSQLFFDKALYILESIAFAEIFGLCGYMVALGFRLARGTYNREL